MIVVMVVSRRVGQVTLAVSERTSCKNLNGLKAIVDVFRGLRQLFRRPEQPFGPSPLAKDEPASGLGVFRGFQSRAGYPSKRAGSRCTVCTADWGKGQGRQELRTERERSSYELYGMPQTLGSH